MPLKAGGGGVKSIQSYALSASLGAGAASLVLYRVLATLPIPVANTPYSLDALTGGFPQIFNGTVTRGFAAVREQQLKAWNNGASDVVYTVRAPIGYRDLTPGVVVATMLLATRRMLPTGEAKTMDITVSTVWQKRPEGWRAVYVHESTGH